MKKHLARLGAAAALALLSACAHHAGDHTGHHAMMHGQGSAPDSTRPTVLIDTQSAVPGIDVSPRALTFAPSQRDVEIVWTLPKATAPGARQFRFAPERGITVVGEVKYKVQRLSSPKDPLASSQDAGEATYLDPKQDEIVQCRVSEDGLSVRCLNRHTRPGQFKYGIVITDGQDVFAIDPQIANW